MGTPDHVENEDLPNLEELLEKVTLENLHSEIDAGVFIGNEICCL